MDYSFVFAGKTYRYDNSMKLLFPFSVFLIALTVRMIFVMQWQHTPYGNTPLLDAKAYDDWAMDIAGGHWLRDRAFYQSPLYPYILALLYKAVGHSLLAVGILNALLGAGTVALLAAMTRHLFGPIAAITTAALACFYQPFIFYTAPVMKEPLGLFLLALHLQFALWALGANRGRDYAAAGVTLGLSILVRGNLLLLLPVLPLIAFHKYRIEFARGATFFILTTLLMISPATLHNYIVADDFVPISYADGFNLYIGHFPGANGTNAYPPEVSTDPMQEELATTYTAEHALNGPLLPSQISSYWRGRAFDFMTHNPTQEIVLLVNKIAAFWNNAQPFDNYDIGFIGTHFSTLIAHQLFGFWVIATFATFSLGCFVRTNLMVKEGQGREEIALLLLYSVTYMASVLIFYVTDRYRLPVVIFLLPLAGAATPYLQMLIHYRMGQVGMVAGAATFIMLLLTLRPPVNAVDLTPFDWGALATIYADQGKDRDVLTALDEGMRLAPDQIGAQAFVRGAVAEDHLGHADRAQHWLETALTLYPNDGIAWYNVGRMYAARGDMLKALDYFLKAKELDPSYVLTYYALARVYDRQGHHDLARTTIAQGLAIDPRDERLQELSAQIP